MIFTIGGGFIGGLIGFCLVRMWEQKRPAKNIVEGLFDIFVFGWMHFGFIGLCVGVGSGIGFTYGTQLLTLGTHPYNMLINLFK